MRRYAIVLVLAAAAAPAACATSRQGPRAPSPLRPPSPPRPPEIQSPPATSGAQPGARALASRPEIRVEVTAPSTVPYEERALGFTGQSVKIRLTNTAPQAVAIERLKATFESTRDGVTFPCVENAGRPGKRREPRSLRPGESFEFERPIDCTMPLPGRYEVRTYVRLGDGAPDGGGDDGRPDLAGTVAIDLVGNAAQVPRPLPIRDGAYALMTGAVATRPLAPEAWARGDYNVVVAVINGSATPLPLGPARIAFLVYKRGSPLPCSGEKLRLDLPATLPPGGVHLTRSPITCAPSEEGQYDVVGNLSLGENGRETEIGRVPLRVTRAPRIPVPFPRGTLPMR